MKLAISGKEPSLECIIHYASSVQHAQRESLVSNFSIYLNLLLAGVPNDIKKSLPLQGTISAVFFIRQKLIKKANKSDYETRVKEIFLFFLILNNFLVHSRPSLQTYVCGTCLICCFFYVSLK